jgi:hypothetical protein
VGIDPKTSSMLRKTDPCGQRPPPLGQINKEPSQSADLLGVENGFFSWHRRQTQWWLDQLGMSPYAGLWFAYFKGIATALIGVWLLEGL